jgi:tripartite-type tricarboxylate transporter receptor subunit TctC
MGPMLKAMLVSGLLVTLSIPDAAAEYPERPVRIIVPSAPGGGPDTIARIIASELTRKWVSSSSSTTDPVRAG